MSNLAGKQANLPEKVCFVTIGATASFASLIKAVLSPNFVSGLQAHDYTNLLVQYGADGMRLYNEQTEAMGGENGRGFRIEGFALDKAGLGRYMRLAKGLEGGAEGVVISHAGSGTILDALRLSVPLVVVPNAELLDNHQIELAEALAEQKYVVHGRIDNLAQALSEAEDLRQRQTAWPPVNSGVHRQAKGLAGVIDEEMGFLD